MWQGNNHYLDNQPRNSDTKHFISEHLIGKRQKYKRNFKLHEVEGQNFGVCVLANKFFILDKV